MILIDNIVVYIYDHSFLNFLRCISESRRIKQTWKFSFLEKLRKWKYIDLFPSKLTRMLIVTKTNEIKKHEKQIFLKS